MDELVVGRPNYAAAFKRRFPLSLAIGAGLIVLTIALSLGLPSIYKSRAVVLIEAQEIPQDLVRSLVTSYADQRMQIISQRVLTNSNLNSIIQKYDLYSEERRSETLEAVLEKMREDITMLPISADVVDPKQGKAVKATIAFELAYENRSPEVAQRVANEIVSLFLNENLKQRSETSEETLTFLSNEADKLRANVSDLETRLADFKKKNQGKLPELNNLNLELMNRAEVQITQLDTQLQSLQQQRVYLESELAQQKPTTNQLVSESGQRILGSADRLKILESEFITLSARYGANHPDVIAKSKEISSLRAEVGDMSDSSELQTQLELATADRAVLLQKYSADHPDVKRLDRTVESLRNEIIAANSRSAKPKPITPDNPAYIQLQARLEATNAEIAGVRAQKLSFQQKVSDFEKRLTEAPEVEREYRMLSRDYEIAQAKYQEVLAKKQEAELATSLESNQRGERFTMIEPPVTPEEPSKPNRLAIGLLGTVLSLVGSIGGGAAAETLDSRIYGRSDVIRTLGVPPLAVIPRLENSESRAKRRNVFLVCVALALIAVAILALAIHLFVTPLDVLFFRALRVLGI